MNKTDKRNCVAALAGGRSLKGTINTLRGRPRLFDFILVFLFFLSTFSFLLSKSHCVFTIYCRGDTMV